jgi:hypothetical protein
MLKRIIHAIRYQLSADYRYEYDKRMHSIDIMKACNQVYMSIK